MLMKNLLSKKNRALLRELVITDFKLRYQGSVLGYAWSLLRPLLIFAILYVVFVEFLRLGKDVPHFPVYLLLGIVVWNFFTEMTTQSLGSIVGRGDLIRKIRIPRWIIIISSSLSALINLALNLVVVAILMAINQVPLQSTILFLPLILAELYIFALGLSLFLSAVYVKFRDMGYIWDVILQAFFYLTPIIYPLTVIHNLTIKKLILLNPVAQVMQDARYAVVTHASPTIHQLFEGGWYKLLPYIFVAVTLVIGTWYFRKESKNFAENI
jgi:ABC-2 type transport system permease protein